MRKEKNQDIADVLSELYDEGYKLSPQAKGIKYDKNNPDNKMYVLINTVSKSTIELKVNELNQVFDATLLFEGVIKTKSIEDLEKKLTNFNEKYLKDGIGSTSIKGENIEIAYAVNLFGKNTDGNILKNLNEMVLKNEYNPKNLNKVLQFSGFTTEEEHMIKKSTTALSVYSKIDSNLAERIVGMEAPNTNKIKYG